MLGLLVGAWSPLCTLALRKSDPYHIQNTYVCMTYFVLGQICSLPFLLTYYGRFIIVMEQGCQPVTIREYLHLLLHLPRTDVYYGILTGVDLSVGYFSYFYAVMKVPSTIVFGVDSCGTIIAILIGVFGFHHLRNSQWKKKLCYLLSVICYSFAIIMLVLSR